MTRTRWLWSVGVVLAALAIYRWWGPGDERRIRRVLDELAAVASQPAGDGVASLARAAALGRFFTEDVVIDPGAPFQVIRGRDTLVALAAKVRPPAGEWEVQFVDVDVQVADDQMTAVAHLTATVRGAVPGDTRALEARELVVAFRKTDGAWRIARVTGVEPLERVR